MSGSWWRNQHNKHHSMPQKLGHDVDLNTLPLVAFTEKVAKRLGMGLKMWIRFQAIMFPLLTTVLVALGWQYYLHIRHILRVKNWPEMASIVARHAIWTALITSQFGLSQSALIFLAFDWVGSNYIFINFAVSHTHLDVVPKEDTQVLKVLPVSMGVTIVLISVRTLRTGGLGPICRHLHHECVSGPIQVRQLVDELPKLPDRAPSFSFHATVQTPHNLLSCEAASGEARSEI